MAGGTAAAAGAGAEREEGKSKLHVFASTWNMGGGIERDELLQLERLGLLGRWIPRDPAYDLYVRPCKSVGVRSRQRRLTAVTSTLCICQVIGVQECQHVKELREMVHRYLGESMGSVG